MRYATVCSGIKSGADMDVNLYEGDSWEVLPTLEAESVDSVVTDPPYGYGFMGKSWDKVDTPFRADFWREAMRVLKPGGHMLVFGGDRTFHRTAVALEDAGFELRHTVLWMYGSGFPKSLNVSKAIDKAAGAERQPTGRVKPGHEGFANRGNMSSVQSFKGTLGGENGFARPWMEDPEKVEAYHQETAPATDAARQWDGWGTSLKPAAEYIALVRKPLSERNVAANVLKHGTGAMNVDGCRVGTTGGETHAGEFQKTYVGGTVEYKQGKGVETDKTPRGRHPANVIHDGSDEVLKAFAGYGDGTAARFFYSAKASKRDRDCGGTKTAHPTVKPLSLMAYLCRLITPPGGTVLDPFAGSGTTMQAAVDEGFKPIGIEREDEYISDIKRRLGMEEDLDAELAAIL